MSQLTIFAEQNPATPLLHTSAIGEIIAALGSAGVRFEQWQASAPVQPGDAAEAVIAAYDNDIRRIKATGSYTTVDVVSMNRNHPQKDALRQKFLSEHTHSEDEVRFFVAGQGLFSLHIQDKIYEVLCQKNDLISVPANTTHWFDMGPNPDFVAIRFFCNTEGWVAHYSGSSIADQFSRLNN